MSAHQASDPDACSSFWEQTEKIFRDCQFVLGSMPNVELFSLERAIKLLEALVFVADHPPTILPISPSDALHLKAKAMDIISQLLELRQAVAEAEAYSTPAATQEPEGRGRPKLLINLRLAVELHNLGNSWSDVSDALGCSRRSLYNHLKRQGISTSCPSFTDISDAALDEHVSQISLEHPLVGQRIMKGFLEARGLHITMKRVAESLRRVDPIGVMFR
jgi:hypothetical protein